MLSANPSYIQAPTLPPMIPQPTTQIPLTTPTLLNKHNDNHYGTEVKKEENKKKEQKKEKAEKEEKKTEKEKHPSRSFQTYEETQAVTDSGNVDEIQYLIYVSQTQMPRAIEIQML